MNDVFYIRNVHFIDKTIYRLLQGFPTHPLICQAIRKVSQVINT